MSMHNPPHPGEFIREVYLDELNVSSRTVAAKLKVSPSTFTRLLNGKSSVTPEMAMRLSKTLGRSPESWLAMQNNYDLWQLQNRRSFDEVERLDFVTQ
ncbi:MAG: HigA family addiction module antidote protein [Ardenticatenaceae bacterium]|nr:HigA family addiction module antidote protein [Ardenticatenaceae bacterium]MCB8949336.1 HigA family addiction module antidote protein [Ardenticatenaceae bacterium]